MYQVTQVLHTILLLSTLFKYVFARSVPPASPPNLKKSRKQWNRNPVVEVTMPGFGVVERYVCPNAANKNKKRDGSSSTTFSIPPGQLREMITSFRDAEEELVRILDEILQGEGSSSSMPASPDPTPLLGAALTVPAVDDYELPTTTIHTTTTTTRTTIVTITVPPNQQDVAAHKSTIADADVSNTTVPGNEQNVAASTSTAVNVDVSNTAAPYTNNTKLQETAAALPTWTKAVLLPEATSSAATNAPVSDAGATSPIDMASSSKATMSRTSYIFNAQSRTNVAVYFGQTAATSGSSLLAQCADPDIDIIILSFLTSFSNGYPSVNFGAACGGQTAKMKSTAGASGLLSCSVLASQIASCQATYGKKVLLSIGGSGQAVTFASAADATDFGNAIWNIFGPPGNIDVGLRPFGTVQIDGFDVDKEDQKPLYWDILAQNLRAHFNTVSAKTYYLSAAPQCPYPDASIPLGLLQLSDFVFVQFYNNPSCQIGSPGFLASVQQWSTAIQPTGTASTATNSQSPRLLIGAPAFRAAGSSAWDAMGGVGGVRAVFQRVREMNRGSGIANLGGGMFWDGPEGNLNVLSGKDVMGWAKAGLTG